MARRGGALILLVAMVGLWSPPARGALGDNAVGMNVHDGREPFIDAAVNLGVTWVRMDANWFALEPSDGSYNWTALDAAVNDAVAAGLDVYLTLAYTPSWVPRSGDTDGRSENDVPNTSTEWADFVTDAVTHYSALGVTHFGIWNEPNLTGFWEGTVNDYVNIILVPGAAAVRSACPSCLVLGPDLAHVGDADDYLEDVLTLAPLTTFDIIAHHSYNGFTETGTQIWDGDSFINVLDQQRFTFTRRSLRQVLDAVGWTGEVWMTETGYRAEPIGDANEEALQATYYTRVLEEQLLRAWYTNTFFYEILDCKPDQPTCGIDGYGIMRATSGSPGSRTFPTDFRLKPAFTALQSFIANHPQFTGTTPPPQCGDGVDNDSDGYIDLADRGCGDGLDDDESNDPPRRRIEAVPASGLTLDGDLADWGTQGWVTLVADDWRGTEALTTGDLGVAVAARWENGALWLAFDVTDDTQDNTHADTELWQGDSVQLAFDVAQSYGVAYDSVDDHEINLALVGGQSRSHRFHGPSGATDAVEVAVARAGSQTRYEVRLPAAVVPGVTYASGTVLGFSFLVNDADGAGRVGWMELTPGIGNTKAPYYFGEIALLNQVTPPTDGGVPDGGAGDGGAGDGGASDDGGTGDDGGTVDPDGGTVDPDGDDGCGCRQTTPGAPLFLVLGLWLLLGYWRRRRAESPVRAR